MSVAGPLLSPGICLTTSLFRPPFLPLLYISPSVTFSPPLTGPDLPSFQFRQPSPSPMHFEASFAFRESSQLKLIFKGAAISAVGRPPKEEGWAGLGMGDSSSSSPPARVFGQSWGESVRHFIKRPLVVATRHLSASVASQPLESAPHMAIYWHSMQLVNIGKQGTFLT